MVFISDIMIQKLSEVRTLKNNDMILSLKNHEFKAILILHNKPIIYLFFNLRSKADESFDH